MININIDELVDLFKTSWKRNPYDIVSFFERKLSFLPDLEPVDNNIDYYNEIIILSKFRELIIDKEYLKNYDKSKSHIRKVTLVRGLFKEFGDIYACILMGYYSIDTQSLLKNIANFFETFIFAINNIIDAMYEPDAKSDNESIEDVLRFLSDNYYLHRFFVTKNTLEFHSHLFNGRLIKTYSGFKLNINRILEEQAFRNKHLQKHLKRDYSEEEKEKLLVLLDNEPPENWEFLFDPYL